MSRVSACRDWLGRCSCSESPEEQGDPLHVAVALTMGSRVPVWQGLRVGVLGAVVVVSRRWQTEHTPVKSPPNGLECRYVLQHAAAQARVIVGRRLEREREYEIRLKPLTPITGLDGLCYEIHKHVTIAAYAALGLLANCSAANWCSRGTLTARVGRVDQLTRVAQLTRTISAWALWCSTTVTANHFVGAAHHLY